MSRPEGDRCACDKSPCGMVEIDRNDARAYRAMGAIVQVGLGNVLPGYWVHECWRTVMRVQRNLEHESQAI